MSDEMDLTATWANLAAEVPEHSRRDLPQLERIFYAGAAAVHDVLMLALTATPFRVSPSLGDSS